MRQVVHDLLTQPRHVLALRLTLLLLILHGSDSWQLDVPLQLLCGIALVSLPLTTSVVVWLAIAGASILVNAFQWYFIDNHKYLIVYWCIVCALATAAKDTDEVMSTNARLLIGISFLFATGWKLLAGEYWDGSFLHYTFLTDPRVDIAASWLGNLGEDQLAENRRVVGALASQPASGIGASLTTTDRLRISTLVMSYWTLFIEALVAVAYLVRRPSWFHAARDYFLMAFICTTYFLLPVVGYANALALLGFTQCEVDRKRTRLLYLVVFVIVQLTQIPWKNYLSVFLPA